MGYCPLAESCWTDMCNDDDFRNVPYTKPTPAQEAALKCSYCTAETVLKNATQHCISHEHNGYCYEMNTEFGRESGCASNHQCPSASDMTRERRESLLLHWDGAYTWTNDETDDGTYYVYHCCPGGSHCKYPPDPQQQRLCHNNTEKGDAQGWLCPLNQLCKTEVSLAYLLLGWVA